jgi:hypothetical protein
MRAEVVAERRRGVILQRNVGGLDRVIRVAAGLILIPIGLLIIRTNGYGLAAVALGLLGLGTGLSGFCILYVPFGISTACPRSTAER